MGATGPDTFLVGAAKCGTTALAAFLSQHPDVFVAPKEPSFWATDLPFEPSEGPIFDRERYFATFAGAAGCARAVDASVAYLFSHQAAANIHAYRPDARIIIMIRNPVDIMESLHNQLSYLGLEDVEDFESALALEEDRRAGRRLPPRPSIMRLWLHYRDVATLSPQIERYLVQFPREQIKFVVHDEFRKQFDEVWADLLGFLDVDASFVPVTGEVNASKGIRSPALRRLMFTAQQIPVRRLVPEKVRWGVRRRLINLNQKAAPRPPMRPELRARLEREFAAEIARLGEIVDRDLSAWTSAVAG